MKLKNTTISGIILGLMVISVITFYMLYQNTKYDTEELYSSDVIMDDWTLESSLLNGAALRENKNIYLDQDPKKLTKVYITVFPTEDEEGDILNFSAFDLHKSLDKKYNPILNANVQIVNEKDELNQNQNINSVNATIQVRGNSSRGASYKSYRIKMKDGADTFYGQSVLNLNKHQFDDSKIANKFSMDIMSRIENIASLRTNFMVVYIRDASLPADNQEYEYYGLYTHVEQPNKNYLRIRGFDDNGTLYKATNFEFRLTPQLKNVDDPAYNQEEFESVLSIREGKDHSKILKMLEEVNDPNKDFHQVFTTYFNEENYLTWLACNILLGNEDTISHNYILYNPTNSLTWYFLPWDYDGTFQFGEFESTNATPYTLKGIQRLTGVQLHRRYFKQNGNLEKLTKKVEELLETAFSKSRVENLLNSYQTVLNKTMYLPPDLLISSMDPSEYKDYHDQFYEQIQLNYEKYSGSLKYPMPFFVSEPERTKETTTEFRWEASHDYQGDLITYGITLARDHTMQDIVFSEEGIVDTYYAYTKPIPEGTYYLEVTATDSEGNRQISLDYYKNESQKVYKYGIRQVVLQ
ncbi:CotH kinase family protein [Mobilitalea sibirica]|uniref:CotH kinase family protein n=1 Tax=Mobilitalea sibirica TaxID=1462919 RepID=A0A8J7HAM5_9FIRM|nr:CotH kinase family protein [Mobilitalea sibirica]MBH1941525.1 CotH kinase family protein [Mobilitalea sibirica]